VPGAHGRRHARAVVGDLELDGVGLVAHDDAGARGTDVLERVGQRLLHDAVGAQVDARRQGDRLPHDLELDRQARLAHAGHQRFELSQRRLGRERELVVRAAQDAQQPAHVVDRVAPGGLDGGERLAHLRPLALEHPRRALGTARP
jgi:hypothetical protein